MKQDIYKEALKYSPDLHQCMVSPNYHSPLRFIPDDVKEIGARKLLGYKLSPKEQARLEEFKNSDCALKDVLQAIAHKRL